MKNQQERLIAAVPGFIATIQEQFSEFDVHVLVASTRRQSGTSVTAACAKTAATRWVSRPLAGQS
jgi:RNase P/RNase MRP subunit p30